MTNLFTVILKMSITSTYVALAVIIIRMILKKVPKIFSYVLWLPVWIRLVFPFSFSSTLSFLNFLKPTVQTDTNIINHTSNTMPFIQSTNADMSLHTVGNSIINPIDSRMKFFSIIWIIGIVILLIYSIISYLKVVKNVETATLVKDNIFETDRVTTPFVCGFIKPNIYIPTGIKEKELPYILVHEQIHIKRFDYLIKPFAFLGVILHWFNPLIWLSFALMSKDMEMSCDEKVLKMMGSPIKHNYANSLFFLSTKKSGLLGNSSLSFGESNIKSRIKNVLRYKKANFWVIGITIIITAALIVSLTTNPKHKQIIPSAYNGYNMKALMMNKTPYVGNNSKVVALIDAMPWPVGIIRDSIVLQTRNSPYEITMNWIMTEDYNIKKKLINKDYFYPNSMLLFSLIDNVDRIHYKIFPDKDKEDIPYEFTYTREMGENLLDKDISNENTLKTLIKKLNALPNDQLEKYLEIIIPSSNPSSNPDVYRKSHSKEYETKLPDFNKNFHSEIKALVYDAAIKQYAKPNDGFTIVAPTILYSSKEGNKLKIFVTVFSNRYKLYDKTLFDVGGSVVPAAITYTKNSHNTYTLEEYLEAMDGSYWLKSIKEYCVMPVSKKEIEGLYEKIVKDYESNTNRSELLMKNLIDHLKANNQKGIFLKQLSGELLPLT